MAQTQDTCWEICCTWMGIGCCINEDEYKKQHLPEVTQNEHRHCTDVPCFLILIAVLVSEVVLISYAGSRNANVAWLTQGVNYQGQICDVKNSQGQYTAWPDPHYSAIRVCVKDCAATQVTHIPKINSSPFKIGYPSTLVMNAFCVPNVNYTSNVQVNTAKQNANRAVADLNVAKWMILGSVFIAIVLAFGYLYVIAMVGACLVWVTITLVFAGGIAASYFLIRQGVMDMASNPTQAKAQLGIGIAIAIVVFCLMLAMLWLRKRIQLALALLDEAGHAIRDMKGTLVFPFVPTGLGVLYMAFWIAVALFIYSVSVKKSVPFPSGFQNSLLPGSPTTYVALQMDSRMQNAMIYHFVVLIFILQTIIYYGFAVIAGAVTDWYFSEWQAGPSSHIKKRGNGTAELSNAPVCESALRVCRFHIGSLAFGSLLVTPVRIVNMILTYLIAKTQNTPNKLLLCVLGCAKCCMKCMECIINRVAEEGFIFMSMYGTNFCYSSMTGVKLIWENAGRAAALEGISKYMEIVGKASITLMTTSISLFFFKVVPYYKTHLSSLNYPGVVIFVMAYMISALFMMVFDVAVNSLFLSFLIDESVNAGGNHFASDKLVELVGMKKNDYQNLQNV